VVNTLLAEILLRRATVGGAERHQFHLNQGIPVSIAGFLNATFNHFLDSALYHLMTVLGTKHDVVVDIIYAMVGFPFHGLIISREQVFGHLIESLFHPTPQGVGFQERVSINTTQDLKEFVRAFSKSQTKMQVV